MSIAERNDDDSFQLKRVNDYNKSAVQFITDTRAENANVLDQFFTQNPQLNDTLAKHLLVDSRGQHKDNKSNERLKQAEKVLISQDRKIEKESAKSWQDSQKEYIEQKTNLQSYL